MNKIILTSICYLQICKFYPSISNFMKSLFNRICTNLYYKLYNLNHRMIETNIIFFIFCFFQGNHGYREEIKECTSSMELICLNIFLSSFIEIVSSFALLYKIQRERGECYGAP